MTPLTNISGYAHVAERYGLEESIFLHRIMLWYRTNKANGRNFQDGRWWTYNSVKAFEAMFPWWNAGQIRRIIDRCREKGALLAGNYNEDRKDRTAWYSPSNELLALYGEGCDENAKCICRKQQMHLPGTSDTFDENSKCNIRKSIRDQEGTDKSPYSPPAGDAPAEKAKPKKSEPKYKPDTFEFFWQLYPRKTSRQTAVRAWDKLKPDKELCYAMKAALERAVQSPAWAEQDGRFIPHFSTWLNQRRWEDKGVDLSLLPKAKDAGSYWADAPGRG